MNIDKTELLRDVQWRDLLPLNRWQIAHELTISAPWLIASWVAADSGYYLIALVASFMFFLTGLRQVHNAYHSALGLSRTATQWVMFVLSVLMLGSMQAVKLNHLRHHRYCMGDEDVEAMSARLPWWKAILVGPLFPLLLHLKALQIATRHERSLMLTELAANLSWVVLVFGLFNLPWLRYHVVAMVAGQCLTAFFAVWTVHHDCDAGSAMARTMRGKTKALLTYNMFFHVEHHLFPAVPTCKLGVLATRLDAAAPELSMNRVF